MVTVEAWGDREHRLRNEAMADGLPIVECGDCGHWWNHEEHDECPNCD